MQPKPESCRLARLHLTDVTGLPADHWRCSTDPVTGLPADHWRCSTDPVTGMGEEFFFMHKDDENRFVYICIEDGAVTTTETN